MPTPTTTTSPALHPDWNHARNLLAGITQALRISLAGQVLLGQELYNLKKNLGFQHGGDRKSSAHDEHLNWADWVKAELGLTRPTADRMIAMFDCAKSRLKKLAENGTLPAGSQRLALLCETSPTAITAADRQALHAVIEKITDGDTQKTLLDELRLIKRHVPLEGGDTSMHRKEKPTEDELMGQLAFRFFEPLVSNLRTLRISSDREAFLHTIPLHSSEPDEISLTTLERDLSDALAEVQTTKAIRLKPTVTV